MRWAVLYGLVLSAAAGDHVVGQTPVSSTHPATTRPSNASASGLTPAEPIVTRQESFSIPFQVSPPAVDGQQPAEVRLYVSADRGAHWTQYQRRPPSASRFEFQAAKDGEYWFTIRTVDHAGQLRPAGGPQAELRVIVDTRVPELKVTADIGPSGELRSRWNASDDNLAPETFRLQYRADASGAWQAVAIEPANQSARRSTLAGEASWWPDSAAGHVEVRAEVRDTAGNAAVVNRRLSLERSTTASARMTPNVADAGFKPARLPAADSAPQPTNVPEPTWPQTNPVRPGNLAPPRATAGSATEVNRNERWPSQPTEGSLPIVDREYEEITDLEQQVRAAASSADPVVPSEDDPRPSRTSPSPSLERRGIGQAAVGRPVSGPVHPPIADPYRSESLGLPPGTRPRMCVSSKFQLEYDVQQIEASEVAKVELWVTRDGGRSWNLAMQDPDKQSPILVEVEEEGTYGYRLLVHSTDGLAGQPPQPGELADVWVGADWTKPTAEITSAQYGQGPDLGVLQIFWQADDRRLSSRPITLEFSADPAGPWSTIASGLPNTGRYDWSVDPRVPRQFYMRLQVRDEAGNVATDQTVEPISSAGLSPQGRIRQVRPVGP